jgi:hypothetical protein
VKTPEYSLGIIRTAVQKHDWETFSKHVDSEQVAASAFDGLVGYAMDKETDATVKAFAGGFMVLLKPAAVKGISDAMKKYVETGEVKEDNKKDNAATDLNKQADVGNMEFKGIAYTKKKDNLATVGIKVYDKELAKEFVIDVKMRELPDGKWQAIGLPNLKDYLAEEEKTRVDKGLPANT